MSNIKEAFPDYEKPTVAVDTVIFRVVDAEVTTNRGVPRKAMQVLLVRKNENEKWQLPGTILRLGETSREAIDRIVKNKAHIENVHFEQLYTVDDKPERDERGHIISIVYIGIVNDTTEIELADKSEYETMWFWLDKFMDENKYGLLESYKDNSKVNELMYDHLEIIHDAINRVQGKLMYTNIGFEFMQDKFTIRELENTFCAIKMNTIPGFRRIIADKIEGTGIQSDGKAFRPAEMFKVKTDRK